jgi:hypothetical protein
VTASAAPGPLRVAFVGQRVYFRQCALEVPADGVEPCFLDFRAGAPAEPLMAELAERDPDIVLVFRPEIIPGGLFQQMRALTIGYLTEPLPREGRAKAHADLRQRMWWLERVDPANFDRIISFDPLIAETAGSVLPVWRSLPIPVADSIYRDPQPMGRPPRLLFVGRPTQHREELLEPIKRGHQIVHIGHGLYGELLLRFLDRADIQLNLHNNPYPTFENRMLQALAAGHLVISEPLSPDHGLEPGGHFLEARTPEDLQALVAELVADPEGYARVRDAGREAAERFRASRVYPGLLREALADVAENGGRAARAGGP